MRVLIVRPSSLGDIVHALPLVGDVLAHAPGAAIDWVAEEAFVPLVALDRRVRRVIPVAFRRWRDAPFASATRRAFSEFRHELRRERYDVVLDLQEQVKGALIARMASGVRHGLDRRSIREPIATLFDDVHHRIDRNLHFLDKARSLAAAALGYAVEGPPRWQLTPPASASAMPPGPYALALHATSRRDKLWPEDRWRALLGHFAQAGIAVLLPWGNGDERTRSERIAQGARNAVVPPAQSLPEMAALARHALVVVGVDTGLTHLAAALGTPTVALFTATDAALAGVARVGAHARDVGGNGRIPALDDAIAAVAAVTRDTPRC
ncbi:MAG: lipopolysaccharide heptosyltransferase I [Burkholderiales bacterium]|nr:lipopolysaccharide heptosyltransferase I [Burkholderiales bacterium]